jgi:hypothetical protein
MGGQVGIFCGIMVTGKVHGPTCERCGMMGQR